MEFQAFTVTCVTCESRLRVPRADLVDAIVKCPKCHSMVQLSRPAVSSAGGEAVKRPRVAVGTRPVDTDAITKDSIAADSSTADGQPATADPLGETETITQIAPPVVAPSPGDHRLSHDRPETAQENSSPLPSPEWHSEKTVKSRRIAMAIAVAIVSLISLVLLVTALLRGSAGQTKIATTPAADDLAPAVSPVVDTEAEARGTAESVENAENAAEPTADLDDAAQPASPNSTGGAGMNPLSEEQPTAEREASVPPNEKPTGEVPDETATQPPSDLLPQNPLLPNDPLTDIFSPASPIAPKPEDDSADVAKLKELPEGLRELFGGLSGMERPQFVETEAPPPTIDEFQVDRAADQPVNLEQAVETPKAINMRAAFGMQVAMQSADPAGYPLNDLMLVIGQLSGVPIDLEWVSLELCQTPLTEPIPLPNGWPTLEAILSAACETIGADYEMNDRAVTVRPSEERLAKAIDTLIDLADLGDGQGSAIQVARRLLRQADGDPARVTLPEQAGPQQVAGLVCEAIRRVRDRPGRLSDTTFARWGGEYSDQLAAWPALTGGKSGPVRLQPATIASLVRQISKRNGATCYINWRDGATAGLMPGEQRMPRTGPDVTAAEALEQVFGPSGLQIRVVDSSHWWVGSQASFDRFPVVIWFDNQQDAETHRSRVQAIVDGASGGGEPIGTVAVDPVSDTCLAVIPRFLLRQMPRLLTELR